MTHDTVHIDNHRAGHRGWIDALLIEGVPGRDDSITVELPGNPRLEWPTDGFQVSLDVTIQRDGDTYFATVNSIEETRGLLHLDVY